jgi:hypothetical protein
MLRYCYRYYKITRQIISSRPYSSSTSTVQYTHMHPQHICVRSRAKPACMLITLLIWTCNMRSDWSRGNTSDIGFNYIQDYHMRRIVMNSVNTTSNEYAESTSSHQQLGPMQLQCQITIEYVLTAKNRFIMVYGQACMPATVEVFEILNIARSLLQRIPVLPTLVWKRQKVLDAPWSDIIYNTNRYLPSIRSSCMG